MLKKLIVSCTLAIALLLPYNAVAFDEWTKDEVVCEVVWQSLHIVDWTQTRYIADNPDEYHERNPILGRHPSEGRVNTYMLAGAIIHPIITHVLPTKYRKWWLGSSIVITTSVVAHNKHIGIKMKW